MAQRASLVILSVVTLLSACASKTEGNDRDTMTQRQKDSVLGQSGIPGSKGVDNALRASDSLKARQAQLDSASRP